MKKHFADPTADRAKTQEIKSPWTARSPSFDEIQKICVGTDHGLGYNVPVGHKNQPSMETDRMPMNCISHDHKPYNHDSIEIVD